MKKLMSCLAGLLLVACLISGCAQSDATHSYTDASQVIKVKVGESFSIVLKANPTTGYDWQYTGTSDLIEMLGDKSYQADNTTGMIVGGGGKDTFTFKTVGKGTATLDFLYKRVWETTSAEQKSFTVEVS